VVYDILNTEVVMSIAVVVTMSIVSVILGIDDTITRVAVGTVRGGIMVVSGVGVILTIIIGILVLTDISIVGIITELFIVTLTAAVSPLVGFVMADIVTFGVVDIVIFAVVDIVIFAVVDIVIFAVVDVVFDIITFVMVDIGRLVMVVDITDPVLLVCAAPNSAVWLNKKTNRIQSTLFHMTMP